MHLQLHIALEIFVSEKALTALKAAYLEHVRWMHNHADELESGKSQHHVAEGTLIVNKSDELAQEFRHRANNLHAMIDAYERQAGKGDPS
jgi:hypothetical protein